MTTRYCGWAAVLLLACWGCRACSDCYDYSSPVAEPIDGGGHGRAGSNLSQISSSDVVPVGYTDDPEAYVTSLPDEPDPETSSLPWYDSEVALYDVEPAPQSPFNPPPPLFVR